MSLAAAPAPCRVNHATLKEFPGLSLDAFQHPLDRQATAALQSVPLFPQLVKGLTRMTIEKMMRLQNISGCVRLGPNQGRSVYAKFVKAAAILGLRELPEVYLSSHHVFNATAFGMNRYMITLHAPLVDALSEDELLAVIAHELGHVKCNHMLNKTVSHYLSIFGMELLTNCLPVVGALAAVPLQLAVLHWSRMAELSCDRAALLVVQDPEVVSCTLSKLAGSSMRLLPEINLEGILEQSAEYDEADEKALDKFFKLYMMLGQTHPFPIVRVRRIMEWAQSEEYRNILAGRYPREQGQHGTAGQGACLQCGQAPPPGADFCPTCGTRAVPPPAVPCCDGCQTPVEAAWKMCPRCGKGLAQDPRKWAMFGGS